MPTAAGKEPVQPDTPKQLFEVDAQPPPASLKQQAQVDASSGPSEESDDESSGGGGGWSLRRATAPVFEIAAALATATAAAWRRWYLRLPLLVGGGAVAFLAALGLLLAPLLERVALPHAVAHAQVALQREVGVHKGVWGGGERGSEIGSICKVFQQQL